MKVLLDNCVPDLFPTLFEGHEVKTARQLGWDKIANGQLLKAAEEAGFQVLITIDRKMQFQSSLRGLAICVAVIEDAVNSKVKLTSAMEAVFKEIKSLAAEQFRVFRPSDSSSDENVP